MKEKTYDVVAMGELLVDFAQCGQSAQGNSLFEACPGGAPCNMLSRLGKKTAFIGKVGDDMFGRLLRGTITDLGIQDRGLITDGRYSTTLAFVQNDASGDRSFTFARKPGADMMLTAEELDCGLIRDAKIFHFGTLSMTHPGVRAATKRAVAVARDAGALISFDPNLRPPLWDSLEDAREQMAWGCGQCDILKISEEEAVFLTGAASPQEAADLLRRDYPGIRLLLITWGRGGSEAFYKDFHVMMATYLQVKTVDTTGAGDTFCGCCLGVVLDSGLEDLDGLALGEMLDMANAGASLVTTKKGAIRSMPTRGEIEALRKKGR